MTLPSPIIDKKRLSSPMFESGQNEITESKAIHILPMSQPDSKELTRSDMQADTPAIDLENITPQQRARLDSAVIALVNYLVSASMGN
jgi:hypothetical protein